MSGSSDFKGQAHHFMDEALKAANQAKARIGDLTHQNRDKIENALDKAGKAVDEKTGGKYADTVAKVKAQATKGVELLEKQGTTGDAASGTPAGTTPTDTVTPGPSATPPPPGGTPASPVIPPYAPRTAHPPMDPPSDGWHKGPNDEWLPGPAPRQ